MRVRIVVLVLSQVAGIWEPMLRTDDVTIIRTALTATVVKEPLPQVILVSRTLPSCGAASDAAAKAGCHGLPLALEFSRAIPIPPLTIPRIIQASAGDV